MRAGENDAPLLLPEMERNQRTTGVLGAKTQLNYEGYYHSHIKPVFGHLQIDSIKTMQILDFFNELREARDAQGWQRRSALQRHTRHDLPGIPGTF